MITPLVRHAALLALTCTATAQAAKAPAFSLLLREPETRIRSGKVETIIITKRFFLNADDVARSRKIGRISTRLTPRLKQIYARVDARKAKPAVFENRAGHWIAAQQSGWTVDREATKERLLKAIQSGKNEATLVVKRTEPQRSVKVLARRGILYHRARGTSNFRGSPSFRVKNIRVGATKLDNVSVPPGKEFDFGKLLGPVDEKHGFVPGYVIAGGTLDKEDGGGICQVSTTVFRAAYQAGLPITERHEHSHRVRYYDPVGYEATVYLPTKNLRFKNDTKAHVFIQASWNMKRQTLTFDIFGAKPDRKVKVGRPVVSNFESAAKPTYVADKNVPFGRARRLDTPMQGMTSVITRRITYQDGRKKTDRTKSVYKPWGAVYAVNPKDKRLK